MSDDIYIRLLKYGIKNTQKSETRIAIIHDDIRFLNRFLDDLKELVKGNLPSTDYEFDYDSISVVSPTNPDWWMIFKIVCVDLDIDKIREEFPPDQPGIDRLVIDSRFYHHIIGLELGFYPVVDYIIDFDQELGWNNIPVWVTRL